MNEILSRIVADLFGKSKGDEELSSKIHRLRDEIKKVIEGEDTIFGKFRGLEESFREVIPEEKQRYNAAIKALSTTSKLSRQEIIAAVNNQLDELKILEKGLMPALPGWHDERKVMETKSQEMRGEIAKLRERIVWLESEEKGLLNGMATREKEMELVEKAMRELFTDIGAEITYIKKKVEEFAAESAAAQPVPHRDTPSEKKEVGEQKIEIRESSAPKDTEWQKKCPMCGGRMDFLIDGKMWMCYSCAYEELKEDEVQGKIEEKSEHTNAPKPTPHRDSIEWDIPIEKKESGEQKIEVPDSSAPKDTEWQKKCPMCGGRMDFLINEKMWQCYSCAYEEKGEQTNAPKPTPHRNSIEWDIPSEKKEVGEQKIEIRESSAPKDTEWQKKCPMCGGRMDFLSNEEMWQCYSCAYEELKKNEVQGKIEEKKEHTDAPKPGPASAPIFDPFSPLADSLTSLSSNENEESKKKSSSSNKQPSTKKKACPVCRKKMQWYQTENAWRCPFCEYERRI